MQPARPSVADQREEARIVTPLERHGAQRPLHVGVGHINDALCASGRAHRQTPAEPAQRTASPIRIDMQGSSQKLSGPQPSQLQVRVRDGRLVSAAIAGRAGIGPGAFGPDTQGASRIQPGDGAPAGPDGLQGHGWDLHCDPGEPRLNRERHFAVHQANVRRGSAHVECDDLDDPESPRQGVRGQDASGGTGQSGVHRLVADRPCGGGQTARLEDSKLSADLP